MSLQLQSLDDFLGEPVIQALPGSFVSRPAVLCNEARGPILSGFWGLRSGVASRLATMTRRLQSAKHPSAELENERAILQKGASVRNGVFKTQQRDNDSSGDETASSDPFGAQCVCFDLTDSDDESDTDSDSDCTPSTRAQRQQRRHSIEAVFEDVRFLARCVWPEPWDFAAGVADLN